jgi:CheY-like chemotaxis protein
VISVMDTGVGLAPEHLKTVFDMFFQVDPNHTVGGLGLGLTLVRSIIERHGGDVEVRSAGPGQGSEFIVRLPLAAAPSSMSTPAPERSSITRGQRILIVDDNADAATAIAELLRLEGHRVETAHDGAGALHIAQFLEPDVVFIDLNMPVMDGYELARRLQSDFPERRIRLVAITGMGRAEDMERTRAVGFELHLIKPANPNLIRRIAAGTDETGKVVPLHSSDSAKR